MEKKHFTMPALLAALMGASAPCLARDRYHGKPASWGQGRRWTDAGPDLSLHRNDRLPGHDRNDHRLHPPPRGCASLQT